MLRKSKSMLLDIKQLLPCGFAGLLVDARAYKVDIGIFHSAKGYHLAIYIILVYLVIVYNVRQRT